MAMGNVMPLWRIWFQCPTLTSQAASQVLVFLIDGLVGAESEPDDAASNSPVQRTVTSVAMDSPGCHSFSGS